MNSLAAQLSAAVRRLLLPILLATDFTAEARPLIAQNRGADSVAILRIVQRRSDATRTGSAERQGANYAPNAVWINAFGGRRIGRDLQVVVFGHSIAGEEMTRFVERSGSRCAGLVYLDAAYDRSGLDTLAAKQPSALAPGIRASDTVSFRSVRALYARVLGVEEPESDIRATERFDAADRYQPKSLLTFVQAVVADSRARIVRLPQYQIGDVPGSSHYDFLQHPREVAAAMRASLGRPR